MAPWGVDPGIVGTCANVAFEEEMIARARRHRLGRLSVPLPAPEDLIIMKAIAHRPRTLALAPPALSPTTIDHRAFEAATEAGPLS